MGLGNLLRSISSERIRKYLFQEGSNLPPRKYSTFFLLSSPRASTCTYLMHMKTCLVPIPTGLDYQSVKTLLCSLTHFHHRAPSRQLQILCLNID